MGKKSEKRSLAKTLCLNGKKNSVEDKQKYYYLMHVDLSLQNAVYEICLKTCDDGMDGTEVFPEYPQVIADK